MQAGATNNTVSTQVTALSLTKTLLVYGQHEGYGTQVTTPTGDPVAEGTVQFLNGSTTLATGSLTGANATINTNNVVSQFTFKSCTAVQDALTVDHAFQNMLIGTNNTANCIIL